MPANMFQNRHKSDLSNENNDQNVNVSVRMFRNDCHDKSVSETYIESELFLNSNIDYRYGVSVVGNKVQNTEAVQRSKQIINCKCTNGSYGIHRLSKCRGN